MSDRLLNASAEASNVPERFDPEAMHGEIIEAEHLARYRWASALVQGRRVLDAGCGTAYGSTLLAGAGATEVVGVDCVPEVLDAVRPDMPSTVVLEAADVTSLPYPDGCFDVVVCFEVIEHLDAPGRALDEFRRVLTPQGVLAISSPNRDVYPPGNPHHVHEYTPAELEQDLSQRFSSVRLERQHTWITSAVLDDARFQTGEDGGLGKEVCVRKLDGDKPGSELYTVALAGQRELPIARATFELAAPVELRKWDHLWHEQDETLSQQAEMLSRQAQLLTEREQGAVNDAALQAQLRHEIEQLRGQLETAEIQIARLPALDARAEDLLRLNDELLRRNEALLQREEDLDELLAIADRYTVVVESTSWKLTRPLRNLVVGARKLGR
jgi:2-polyprenyl-3-methyl-5-hydroxy-6-metoxy-1,4-benzoquinol methylase